MWRLRNRSGPPGQGGGVSNNRTFLALLGLVTLAMAWVISPLFGAVFWAVVFCIVLDPWSRKLSDRLGDRRNLAAATMILASVLLIILPMLLLFAAVLREATGLIASVQSGEIDFGKVFQSTQSILPHWLRSVLTQLGFGDLAAVQASIAGLVKGWIGDIAPVILSIGQNMAGLFISLGVMLYLMFFLFRDGKMLLARLKTAIPMETAVLDDLLDTFTLVVRATVRGDILVALLQGSLGGLGFWVLGIHAAILWTVLMSVMSLIPVLGAGLIWLPVSIYFLANGMIWQGVALILYGVLVISLVDNLVRPWLVGQATRLPDYVVLISTIGGISVFGMQGFVTGPVIAAMFIAVWTTYLSQVRAKA